MFVLFIILKFLNVFDLIMCYNGLCMRQVFGGELAFVFAELPTLAVMHYVLRISLAMHASSAMAVTFRNLAHNGPHSRRWGV